MSNKSIFKTAIKDKLICVITYGNNEERIIEPHVFYEHGGEKLLAYQTSGASESGKNEGWKRLDVNIIKRVDLSEETFEPRDFDSTNLGTVFFEVD